MTRQVQYNIPAFEAVKKICTYFSKDAEALIM